jgi:multidrug efflux system membrane fusion protein
MDEIRSDVAQPSRPDQPYTAPPISPVTPPPPPARGGSGWRWLGILLALLVVGWLLWHFLLSGSGTKPHVQQPLQPVGVAKVISGDMKVVLTGLGTVTPVATVTVVTQISGQLMSVGFKEGQVVKQGDFLAQIDPRPYQVALAQDQGTLAHDMGLLAMAKSDLERYATLNRKDSISRQQVADQQFLVQQYEGTVAVDRATIDSAKLNLTYCHITSPVTGRVGLRLVDPGNYVQASSGTGLVVVTELQPISVVFVLPEDDIPDIQEQMMAGATLEADAYDRSNAKLLAKGTLITVDNTVDTTTGTVKLRASFPNTDLALFPNQFVNARLLLKTIKGAAEVPVAAVQHGAPGTFVYVVKPDNTVGVQVITTGVTDGDNMQVTKGLTAGDTVVVDGTDRLKDGAKIKVNTANTAAEAPAGTNGGPGAPPGEQPQNATPVPAQNTPGKHHHKKPASDQ